MSISLDITETYLLHIWFISCRMASLGLMHNLSKMMVIPYSAGDATQLEMPAE